MEQILLIVFENLKLTILVDESYFESIFSPLWIPIRQTRIQYCPKAGPQLENVAWCGKNILREGKHAFGEGAKYNKYK